MRHSITVDGPSCRLRPVEMADAQTMIDIRTEDPARSRFINATSPQLADQQAYLEAYFERAGDCYFMIERKSDSRPLGLVAIYDIGSEGDGWAEWGRWILRPGVNAAMESAWLTYKAGFEELGLKLLYCRTVAANEKVVSFHDSFGLKRHGLLKDYVTLNGQVHDSVEHRLTAEEWPQVNARLAPMIARMARFAA